MANKLLIDMVSNETKNELRKISLKKYGKENISMLIRSLIDDCINKSDYTPNQLDLNVDSKPVEIILPISVIEALDELADKRFSTRRHLINCILFDVVGSRQLLGDEIEVLRKSNYEISKIGSNINQIAKAFNVLVAAGGGGKVPEIGKKMAAISGEMKLHTKRVLAVLNSGSIKWEGKPRGGKKRK